MKCPACGKLNDENAKKCARCGEILEESQEAIDGGPTQGFNEQFIYNNQTNFNNSNIDNSGGAQVPDDPELGLGFDDDDIPDKKKKQKPKRAPLSNIIIFASSLVALITIFFLILLLVLGRKEYIHSYICSNYYDNMPPKELLFNINFKLRKDDYFLLEIDKDNYVEGKYEVVEETTDGKNNRYTINLKASSRMLGGIKKSDDYDEQYNLTFMGEDTYLESTTSDFKYLCKITE